MFNWAIEIIKNRLLKKTEQRYTGKVGFDVNMFEGGIANMNINTRESLKPSKNDIEWAKRDTPLNVTKPQPDNKGRVKNA